MKIGNEEFSYEEMDLMATYEQVFKVPDDKRVTQWWGDMAMYEFKVGVKADDAKATLDKSLAAINMAREEFEKYHYTYFQNLIDKMQENLPEQYEVIALFDRPVLMSEGRVKQSDVPEGFYSYELRHDEGGDIATLEKSVRVDFAGTILSKDEIEIVGDHKKIDYDDYNFLSLSYTAEEFKEKYDELVAEFCEQTQSDGIELQ